MLQVPGTMTNLGKCFYYYNGGKTIHTTIPFLKRASAINYGTPGLQWMDVSPGAGGTGVMVNNLKIHIMIGFII